MSARIEDVLAEHADCTSNDNRAGPFVTGNDVWSCGLTLPFEQRLEDAEHAHIAAALTEAGFGDVAQARKDALLEAADEMDAFADMTYSADIFVRPTDKDYAAINALLHRERGHKLDGVAADCYSRAIHVQAARLRDHAADEVES